MTGKSGNGYGGENFLREINDNRRRRMSQQFIPN